VICGATGGYAICGTGGGTLFEELAKVAGDWLWHNGRIDSMPDVGFGCSGRVAVEEATDRMKNIAGGEEPIAWCG
jgi:hypothetical protein